MSNKRFKLWCVLFTSVFLETNLVAQDYPFDLPNNITATYDIETGQTEVFQNELLGYNINGFKSEQEKDFIRKVNPISIRFPHGIFSNHYQWQTDKYQKDSFDNGHHETVLTNYAAFRTGDIEHIQFLNTEKEAQTGKKQDMLWTYSLNFDDAASSVARATQDIERGFQVKNIELGNELYFESQRANQTATHQMTADRAESVANALKAKYPNIKVSIPLTWREWHVFDDYNTKMVKDGKYYDAVSLHAYLGNDIEGLGAGNTNFDAVLAARLTLAKRVGRVRTLFAPGKPIWLSEWGVSPGVVPSDLTRPYAGSCLGMADVFIYMAENQDIYQTANWFAFNTPLNAMVLVENFSPVYPLKRRGYLSTYEIVYDVFKDATLFKGSMSTIKLNTSEGQMDGVSSRVAIKDGSASALIVNLTDKPVNYILKIDGVNYTGNFRHDALVFDDLGHVENRPFDENQLTFIKQGTGVITLPPLSVSKLTNLNISLAQGPEGYKYITSEFQSFNISDAPQDIAYGHNGSYVFLENQTGNIACSNAKFGSDPLPGVKKHCFIKESKVSFLGTPHPVPGTIEAEHYDYGGQGVSYSDANEENKGPAGFRPNSGVDIGASGDDGHFLGWTWENEWLEYTVDVESTGDYQSQFFFASPSADGLIGLEVDGESLETGISIPSSGGWGVFSSFSETIPLESGEHIIRLNIEKGGFTLDKMVLSPSTVTSTNELTLEKSIIVFPNPNNNGIFNLSLNTEWSVFTLQGVELLSGNGTKVNLSDQEKGIYIIRLPHGGSRRVVIN